MEIRMKTPTESMPFVPFGLSTMQEVVEMHQLAERLYENKEISYEQSRVEVDEMAVYLVAEWLKTQDYAEDGDIIILNSDDNGITFRIVKNSVNHPMVNPVQL